MLGEVLSFNWDLLKILYCFLLDLVEVLAYVVFRLLLLIDFGQIITTSPVEASEVSDFPERSRLLFNLLFTPLLPPGAFHVNQQPLENVFPGTENWRSERRRTRL